MTGTIELTIFHTNDMHGHLEAMARLSAFARRLRADARAGGREVFFWDAGDASDRRVRLCSVSKGAAFSPIMNAMGYTLQTMGNDVALLYGPEAMREVAARADFPILAANCRDGTGPLPEGLEEDVTLPLPQGLTLGVIGLTAPWGGLYELYGLHFPDFCDTASGLVARLRSQGASPILALSHLGLEDDRRLAQQVRGITMIIGAHSHDCLPTGEECNGVLIAQAGQFAEALGRIDLTLDSKTGEVISRSACVLDVPEREPPDPLVLDAIAAAEREAEAIMAQPIGVLASPLDLDYFQECGIGDLTADALREHFDAEIALVSTGVFHEGLPAGKLTFGALDNACFTTANPCLTDVRGAQVLEALERGLDPAISQFKHHGFRGSPIGIAQISGMVVDYMLEAEAGPRVLRVLVRGEPLELDRTYRLAHTDAETIPEVCILILEEGQKTKSEAPTIVREVMEAYVRQHSPVPPPGRGRWRAVT